MPGQPGRRALPGLRAAAYGPSVAGDDPRRPPRLPERGLDDLHRFATLQRQVAERAVPLHTRERRRRRANARRLAVRLVLVLAPLVLLALLAADVAGSRTWLQDRWQQVTETAPAPSPAYSVGTPVRAS